MAYTNIGSTKRTTHLSSSRGNLQQPTYSQKQPSYSHAQEHHIFEEQPYYSNEQTTSRQSMGGDNRRTGGVSSILINRLK